MNLVATFWENTAQTPLQIVEDPFLVDRGIRLYIKRDDLIHAEVSGNKWRKLKYNLIEAERLGFKTLFTFGGAYSNHIAAVAAAGKEMGFQTIGVIRGEELSADANPTLRFAAASGMELIFVSREAYRDKSGLAARYGNGCYVLPEGGSNHLAVLGISEVMSEIKQQLNYPIHYMCTAFGTGATAAGLATHADTKVLVFPSLKLSSEVVKNMIGSYLSTNVSKLEIMSDYHFGGYGRTNDLLLDFVKSFENQTGIPLEEVYTGKMMFGIYDLVKKGFFRWGDTLVGLHTGGLQGKRK
ncbi:MAG: 1-aminocyclopropane-1-carboxylate deaminase/D-cysteine desulfhydrase [Runella zeae]